MSDIPVNYYIGSKRDRPAQRVKRQCRVSTVRSRKQVQTLLVRDGDQCHYCGVVMTPSDGPTIATTMTREHIVPRCYGGANSLTNLVLACNACNNDRGREPSPCSCSFCKQAYTNHEGN